jgi:hypothetical protein
MSELRERIRTLTYATLIAAGSIAIPACSSGNDSHGPEHVPMTQGQRDAAYAKAVAGIPAKDRFELDFIGVCLPNPGNEDDYRDAECWVESGKYNIPENEDFSTGELFGQDCLAGTTYDTAPAEIMGGDTRGTIPASAGVETDPLNENLITVNPAAPAQPSLHLEISADGLRPMDEVTTSILRDAYGCAVLEMP